MERLTIERLGTLGDGVAKHNGRDVFVPFALPNETVEADIQIGSLKNFKIIETSEQEQIAPCAHFKNVVAARLSIWG